MRERLNALARIPDRTIAVMPLIDAPERNVGIVGHPRGPDQDDDHDGEAR